MNRLDSLFHIAENGREIWLDIVKRYSVSYDTVVYLFPHVDSMLNEYALKHAKEVLNVKRANRLVVLSLESMINYKDISIDNKFIWEKISKDDMCALLKYNDMTSFSSQLIIVSFEHGSDCSMEHFTNYNNIVLEELCCIGILGLPEYVGE